MKEVNNLHLVCSNLHQIANLYVNLKLSFVIESLRVLDLESLLQSSRIFEELEFSWGSGINLLRPEKFEMIEDYVRFTGIHVKKFIIRNVGVDQRILQKLLNSLSNLESLELELVYNESEEPINWDLKASKIKRLKVRPLSCQSVLPQWEHFIQKGGQKFFLFKFMIFGVEIMFSMVMRISRQFFDKIRPGQFVGQK